MNIRLIKLAKETIKISEDKYYYFNNKSTKIETYLGHPIYKKYNKPTTTITETNNNVTSKVKFTNTKVEVQEESSVDALLRFAKLHEENSIGLLNFASAKHPGGGFLNGAVAQEECLSYCSNLFLLQKDQKYYEINKKYNKHYTDTMIISQTIFFRDSKYNLIEKPIECCVITCPAVNRKIAGYNNTSDLVMKNRMRKILIEFINHEQTNIILGAYGCGVFGNKPEQIALFWKELLEDENLKQYFNHITFSIKGKQNYNVFKNIFS